MYDSDKYLLDSFKSAQNPQLAEKDYLECMILDRLFEEPYFKENFVFAGGGTITKIYRMGNRIGQDIDLALMNFEENPQSNNQLKKFRTKFTKFVFEDLNIKVQATIKHIGNFEVITDVEQRIKTTGQQNIGVPSPTLHLSYYSELNPHIKGTISIEFIPRHYDSAEIYNKPVTPYSTGSIMTNDVPTVHYAQTFWDKVYALHTIHQIGLMRPGLSNHYYDVASLSKNVNLDETQHMLFSIAEYQKQFTTRKLAPLQSVTDVKLMPNCTSDMKSLSVDYQTLRGRFIGAAEPWPRVLMTINKLNKNLQTLKENSK
jgi:hypothetical protein